jgi:hypothetical protein
MDNSSIDLWARFLGPPKEQCSCLLCTLDTNRIAELVHDAEYPWFRQLNTKEIIGPISVTIWPKHPLLFLESSVDFEPRKQWVAEPYTVRVEPRSSPLVDEDLFSMTIRPLINTILRIVAKRYFFLLIEDSRRLENFVTLDLLKRGQDPGYGGTFGKVPAELMVKIARYYANETLDRLDIDESGLVERVHGLLDLGDKKMVYALTSMSNHASLDRKDRGKHVRSISFCIETPPDWESAEGWFSSEESARLIT